MNNFAIVSLLLVCFLVVSAAATRFAPVYYDSVSAALEAGAPYAVVANPLYASVQSESPLSNELPCFATNLLELFFMVPPSCQLL